MRKHWAALAAAITIGSLAACGGGGGSGAEVASIDDTSPDATDDTTDGTTVDAPTDPEEAMLAFTECMRDHGVDMPDPQKAEQSTGGAKGGGAVIAVEGDPDDPTFKKANEACGPLMENARGELVDDPERQAEMQQQMLEFAQCIRDQGIDMPDPVFDGDGRVKIDLGDEKPQRDTAAFNEASEACSKDGGGPMVQMAAPGEGESDSDSDQVFTQGDTAEGG